MAIVQADAKSWHGITLRQRFEAKIMPEPMSGCWLWTGSVTGNNNYGNIRTHKGQRMYVHRLSYLLYKGDIPIGQQVLHRCDNSICCNPDHLFLGTQLENIKDRDMKKHTRNRYSVQTLGPARLRVGGQ